MIIFATYDSMNLVVPAHSEGTILDLITLLRNRFAEETGDKDVYIPQLSLDGYLLNPRDKITDVVYNKAKILAWNNQQYSQYHEKYLDLKNPFLSLSRDDFKDSLAKWARVGYHKHNKLYVQLGVGKKVHKLFLLGVKDLQQVRDPIIGTVEDLYGTWFIEARLVMDKWKEVTAVSLHVKTASEKQVWADQVQIIIDSHGIIKGGSVTHISGVEPEEDDTDVNYTIPEPKREGSLILMPEQKKIETKKHEPTGDSKLKIQWSGKIQSNQDSWARDGKFTNYFIIDGITAVNTDGSPITVIKVTAEWKDKDGNWKPTDKIALGIDTNGRLQWKHESSTNFNVEGNKSITVAVSAGIQITGEPGFDNEHRARAHKSLPQPLHLRLTFEDQHQKKAVLEVEQSNDPYNLETKESREKSWGVKVEEFVYCDDLELEKRIWFAYYKDKDNHVLYWSYNTYYEWDDKTLKKIAYNAAEAKKAEYPLEHMWKTYKTDQYQAWALVDLERQRVYGVKVYLKTQSGSITQYVLLKKKQHVCLNGVIPKSLLAFGEYIYQVLKDGTVKKISKDQGWQTVKAAAVKDNLVYIVKDGNLVKFNPQDGTASLASTEDFKSINALVNFNGKLYAFGSYIYEITEDGKLRTASRENQWDFTTNAAVLDGTLYVLCSGTVYAWDPSNGSYKTIASNEAWKTAPSMTVAGDKIYIVCDVIYSVDKNGVQKQASKEGGYLSYKIGTIEDFLVMISYSNADSYIWNPQSGELKSLVKNNAFGTISHVISY